MAEKGVLSQIQVALVSEVNHVSVLSCWEKRELTEIKTVLLMYYTFITRKCQPTISSENKG